MSNEPWLPPPALDRLKWDLRFLRLAQHISSWSKDPSTKVGAVLVGSDHIVAGMGYNGFPRGVDDSPAIYAQREIKYSRVVHAEMNAILNCPVRPLGYTLYTFSQGWGPACDRCAAHIIQAGIKTVIFDQHPIIDRALDSVTKAHALFTEAGILIKSISLENLSHE